MITGRYPDERRILRNLKALGFEPSVVYDIGASTGIWSEIISGLFPWAHYHLFEPLANHLDSYRADLGPRLTRLPNLTVHPIALSDDNGPAEMHVFPDGYGSSLYPPCVASCVKEKIMVTSRRLDDYGMEESLPAPDIIKIDCQGSEDAILRGGVKALRSAKVLFLETWFQRAYGAKNALLGEIIELLQSHSFSLVELGHRFYDKNHRLYSVDAFFLADAFLDSIGPSLEQPPAYEGSQVEELTAKLLSLVSPARSRRVRGVRDADVIISHIEVNRKHGVGVLLDRLFGEEPNVISLRSTNHYGGAQEFGDLARCISHDDKSKSAVFARTLDALGDSTAKRILCAPYYPDDVRTGIAVNEIYGVPLCTYLMDDQNICAGGIEDDLMRELLARSSLRLAISPEIRIAYQQKYGYPFWYMPPVVDARLIPSQCQTPHTALDYKHGVVIGNIRSQRWLDLLRRTMKNSGVTLSWYSNGQFRDLDCDPERLAAESIYLHGPPPDEELVKVLRQTWFAVLPSGTLDEADDRRSLAQFSLPSRLVYLMATSHIPVLVLGNRETSAARFVEQFGIGLVAGYERRSFLDAVSQITSYDVNLGMRKRALAVAGRFTDTGAVEWIWQSLERGEPIDRRFEDLMPQRDPDLSHLFTVPGS